jgi:hypothetical protein
VASSRRGTITPQGGELRKGCLDARLDRPAGAFLSRSVCRCLYGVELWKNEGPSPARNFWVVWENTDNMARESRDGKNDEVKVGEKLGCGGSILAVFQTPVRIALK